MVNSDHQSGPIAGLCGAAAIPPRAVSGIRPCGGAPPARGRIAVVRPVVGLVEGDIQHAQPDAPQVVERKSKCVDVVPYALPRRGRLETSPRSRPARRRLACRTAAPRRSRSSVPPGSRRSTGIPTTTRRSPPVHGSNRACPAGTETPTDTDCASRRCSAIVSSCAWPVTIFRVRGDRAMLSAIHRPPNPHTTDAPTEHVGRWLTREEVGSWEFIGAGASVCRDQLSCRFGVRFEFDALVTWCEPPFVHASQALARVARVGVRRRRSRHAVSRRAKRSAAH